MKHFLPRRLAICGRQGNPRAFGKFRFESGRNLPNEPKHGAGFRIGEIAKRRNMATGNHKRVSAMDGADVEKRDSQLVLTNTG